jgi:FkbM family methyltransferase
METPAGMETGEYKINNGPWYWREANFFRAFKEAGFEPQVIFDVGSSDSGWSYDIARLFPKAQFHLFEPLLDHRPFYRENTANILLARPDFRIHKVAVGDVDGTIKIGSDETGYAASTLLNQANVTFTERIEVPIRRLDTMVFELGLPRPDVLKLDVQGAELAILTGSGSLLDHVQLIQAEVWLMRKYGEETPLLHEVNEYLRSKGFFLVALGDFYYGDYHELFAADAFFARTDLLSRCAVLLPKSSLTEKPVVTRVDGAGEKP